MGGQDDITNLISLLDNDFISKYQFKERLAQLLDSNIIDKAQYDGTLKSLNIDNDSSSSSSYAPPTSNTSVYNVTNNYYIYQQQAPSTPDTYNQHSFTDVQMTSIPTESYHSTQYQQTSSIYSYNGNNNNDNLEVKFEGMSIDEKQQQQQSVEWNDEEDYLSEDSYEEEADAEDYSDYQVQQKQPTNQNNNNSNDTKQAFTNLFWGAPKKEEEKPAAPTFASVLFTNNNPHQDSKPIMPHYSYSNNNNNRSYTRPQNTTPKYNNNNNNNNNRSNNNNNNNSNYKNNNSTTIHYKTKDLVIHALEPNTTLFVDVGNWVKETNNYGRPQDPTEAKKQQWKNEQNSLKNSVIYTNTNNIKLNPSTGKLSNVRYIGGVDISFAKNNKVDACASIIVMEYPSLKIVYESYKMVKLVEPYIAGYLAFREVHHIQALWNSLLKSHPEFKPDVIVVDGNGIHHMRGLGLACHLGVMINVPTIGVAKNLLVCNGIDEDYINNQFRNSTLPSTQPVEMRTDRNQLIGHAVRNCNDDIIYMSPGHMIDANGARDVIMATMNNRDISEATYQADRLSRLFLHLYYRKFD